MTWQELIESSEIPITIIRCDIQKEYHLYINDDKYAKRSKRAKDNLVAISYLCKYSKKTYIKKSEYCDVLEILKKISSHYENNILFKMADNAILNGNTLLERYKKLGI
jgi:hypothetical protein